MAIPQLEQREIKDQRQDEKAAAKRLRELEKTLVGVFVIASVVVVGNNRKHVERCADHGCIEQPRRHAMKVSARRALSRDEDVVKIDADSAISEQKQRQQSIPGASR